MGELKHYKLTVVDGLKADEKADELDGKRAIWAGCDEHVTAGLILAYHKGSPGLIGYCRECKKPCMAIAIPQDGEHGEVHVAGDLIGFLTGVHNPSNIKEIMAALSAAEADLKKIAKKAKFSDKEKKLAKLDDIKNICHNMEQLFGKNLKDKEKVKTEGDLPPRWRGWSDN